MPVYPFWHVCVKHLPHQSRFPTQHSEEGKPSLTCCVKHRAIHDDPSSQCLLAAVHHTRVDHRQLGTAGAIHVIVALVSYLPMVGNLPHTSSRPLLVQGCRWALRHEVHKILTVSVGCTLWRNILHRRCRSSVHVAKFLDFYASKLRRRGYSNETIFRCFAKAAEQKNSFKEKTKPRRSS